MWASFVNGLKVFAAYALPWLAPSIAGASMALLLQERRRRGAGHWLNLFVWSVAAGCLLTPLFAHIFGLPDSISISTACFISMSGKEAVDFARSLLRRKAGGE